MGSFGAVNWSRVPRQTATSYLIAATGPSIKAVPFKVYQDAAAAGVHIIAVNGAISWLPLAHSWFSLDPSPVNRLLMRNQRPGVDYYAGVPAHYGTAAAKFPPHRARAEPNICYLKRLKNPGLSETPSFIHTGNSAYGALGLAYLMGAERVAILGVDGSRSPYAFDAMRGRPNRSFRHLPRLFKAAVPQLRARGVFVANGSPNSIVNCFHFLPPVDAVKSLF